MRTGECYVQLICEFPDRYVMDCDAIAEKMITVVCSTYKSLMAKQENMFL